MIEYFIAIVFSLIFARLGRKRRISDNGLIINYFDTYLAALIAMLPLLLLAVFRWNVGIDSVYGGTYWDSYRNADTSNKRGFEPLFFWLMHFCNSIGMPFYFFLALHSCLFMSIVCYALKKGKFSCYISIILFFTLFVYFDSFSSLRQSISEAISMVAIAGMLTEENSIKKDVKTILLFVLAAGFHSISLIFIPIYFVCKLKLKERQYLIVTCISIAIYPLLQILFQTVMRVFFASKYNFIGVSTYNLILAAIILAIVIHYSGAICNTFKYGHVAVDLALCDFVIMMNSGALLLPYRCFDFLKISYVFIVPIIMKSINDGRIRFVIGSILIVIFGYWFINAFFVQNCVFRDYQTILDCLQYAFMP